MLSRIVGVDTLDLLRQDGGTVDITTALQGKKYLLLYFSASWCPPCRLFTRQLANFYESFHTSHCFEVIFFSRDRGESPMRAYFYNQKYSRLALRGGEGSHGDWLAVPYAQAKTLGLTLMQRYAVHGIPTLLLFDLETGELLTRNARNLVARNLDTAEGFPWAGDTGGELMKGPPWCELLLLLITVAVLYYLWQ
ncbi:tryparedoxin [Trypanosoma rangeli]|uniref:Tryparedoxin n=1 Tax=Trypanosoma rangeli TaxID=5698 RepID=A0A422MZX1_TRYRA|nr:tryparedoxin [Trypanosoma rangeli]RNE98772.1 tryparedoxin [Trypanosoma rangeli]|eukprot:RNE98772.1 tryparedoxin [Trypanosoma rangeli]